MLLFGKLPEGINETQEERYVSTRSTQCTAKSNISTQIPIKMNPRRVFLFDLIFLVFIEILFLSVYMLSPTPNQFPFLFVNPLKTYFYQNISQFFAIMFIPYLPEILFGISNVNVAMFLGLSIVWIPSIYVLVWLVRKFFSEVVYVARFKFYYAYFPIIFTLFVPHTLIEIFTFNGTHFFSVLSQIFLMFIAILSGISFYLSGRKKYLLFSLAFILLVNIQTFTMSFFLVSALLLLFSVTLEDKFKAASRSVLLIFVAVIGSFVYLYASHSITLFPYSNLNLPNIGPTDPNYRVFLVAIFSRSKGIWNILTMQNYVNDPYFPLYYPTVLYSVILFLITVIGLLPIFFFNRHLRIKIMPVYLTLISFEMLNAVANPFISLVFPQNISIFYDLSYIFNNNTVFYYPLQILAALMFLISLLSLPDFIKSVKKYMANYIFIDIRLIYRNGMKYTKPVASIILILVLTSPLISYSLNQGQGNPAPYNQYEPFVSYFQHQKYPSVYFDSNSENHLLSLIQSNSASISNPQLTVDQVIPLSYAMEFYNHVLTELQPEYMSYILTTFGYNFLATSNLSLSSQLNLSTYFSSVLNYSGIQVLKVTKAVVPGNYVLMSSSTSTLINLVNTFKEFPDWIYSPYLLNLKSLEELYSSGKNVYMPNFDNPGKFFVYVNGTKVLIPAQYSDNTYYYNQWEIGYLPGYAQETWGQNIAGLNNYTYQSELNVNYGYIYTSQSNASIKVTYTLPAGSYEVYANTLFSNKGGKMTISVEGNITSIETLTNDSYFSDISIGSITSPGAISVDFRNINGFNTVGYVLFVPVKLYKMYEEPFSSYVNESSMMSLYRSIGLVNELNISITPSVTDPNLTYDQEIQIPVNEYGINLNFSNILITGENGNPIPVWIQDVNNNTGNLWIRVDGELNKTLRLFVFNRSVNLLGTYVGENPSMSKIYGEYFNAPSVFGQGNAWDWVNSYQGWITSNGSATFVEDGVHVIGQINGFNTIDGGIYMPYRNLTGMEFDIYGWTENNTVIQESIVTNNHGVAYGWVGSSPYAVEEYPVFTHSVNVSGGPGRFYNFGITAYTNGSMVASISNSTFSASYYPIHYTNFQSSNTITLRESINNPQYYEFAFICVLPLDDIMPVAVIG